MNKAGFRDMANRHEELETQEEALIDEMFVAPTSPLQSVFTTGEIAKLVHVAPRTVCNWIDAGDLQGYRLPNKDRRVTRAQLQVFLTKFNMPFEIPE